MDHGNSAGGRPDAAVIARAQGCLLGQLCGDALGGQVEFSSATEIAQRYPKGVRDLADGGHWKTLAGQPTDDSEMALVLARMLVDRGTYQPEAALKTYLFWLQSGPFDCGRTIADGLGGHPNQQSQANGAMMRVSPLGIFGAYAALNQVASWAEQDAALTHPHPVCVQANALFTAALARAVGSGLSPEDLYREILVRAEKMPAEPALLAAVRASASQPPTEYYRQQGWVLIAFQNALWQLLHAPNLEEALVDTIGRGGDTDTNAAICGALLGAVFGRSAIPNPWAAALARCRPQAGRPGVHRPRPECFWPVDALELAEKLVATGRVHKGRQDER